ncbi:hypothetical protein MNBD_GAMMA09-2944 [hydrothermal vent metagenome]|uniref:Uncharacterized protein n=1 Tax=hydrothermal vent metagenome TaxID=652676 RepID=A0A3B0XQ34_9ZZZZ
MSRDEIDQDKKYQQWQKTYQSTAVELPPQSIDSRILNAAHSAVDDVSDTGIDTAPVKRAWYVPASYVAIVVISLSVVIKIGFEPEVLQMPADDALLKEERPIEADSAQSEIQEEVRVDIRADVQVMSADVPRPQKREKKKSADMQYRNKQQKAKRKFVRGNEVEEIKELKFLHESEAAPSGVRKRSVDKARLSGEVAEMDEVTVSDANTVDGQQWQINNMLKLLENGQFENLKQALKAYRKTYGGVSDGEPGKSKLPEPLLIWERENMPYSDK